MAEPTAAHARDLGDYLSLVRRRWGWIASAVVAGVALSLVYLNLAEPTYVSTAQVIVRQATPSVEAVGARTNDSINLDTEAELVKSADVETRAAQLLGSSEAPEALASRVQVTVPPNTTLLNISFQAPTASDAQRGAAQFARAYLESRTESAQGLLAGQVARLQDQIDRTAGDIEETSTAISRMNGPKEQVDRGFLTARRDTLSNELASYNAELAPLVGTGVDAGEVSRRPLVPGSPAAPDPLLILATGLMAGLVLGLGLAAWRDRTDKRVHDASELERIFGTSPVARLRAAGPDGRQRLEHDVRALYHSLRAGGSDQSEAALLVAPGSPETAERLARALALESAGSGAPTAYVTRPGLLDDDARRRCDVEGGGLLHLSTYDEGGALVGGRLRAGALAAQVGALRGDHDLVVLGLPTNDPAVDVVVLARHVDLAVVAVRLGTTTRDDLARTLADLTTSGVDRVVLVTVDLRHPGPRSARAGAAEALAASDGQDEERPGAAESAPERVVHDDAERERDVATDADLGPEPPRDGDADGPADADAHVDAGAEDAAHHGDRADRADRADHDATEDDDESDVDHLVPGFGAPADEPSRTPARPR